MSSTLTFSIPGKPQTKLRPRFSRWKGKVKTYNCQSDEEQTMKWQLKARMNGPPLEGPLSINLVFVMPRPKSRSKKEIYHAVKPDIDNLIKWILDVGNGILWDDDKQVVSVGSVKIYGAEPRTIITVSGL